MLHVKFELVKKLYNIETKGFIKTYIQNIDFVHSKILASIFYRQRKLWFKYENFNTEKTQAKLLNKHIFANAPVSAA